jgi:HSP20 family molecular chaperone IbpA
MAEEFRDDEKFVIMADVPGLDPETEISVAITTGVLHIRAHQNSGDALPGSDLREGTFSRDIRLPPGADESSVSAIYVDGVLEVRVPMRERNGANRVIPVTRG